MLSFSWVFIYQISADRLCTYINVHNCAKLRKYFAKLATVTNLRKYRSARNRVCSSALLMPAPLANSHGIRRKKTSILCRDNADTLFDVTFAMKYMCQMLNYCVFSLCTSIFEIERSRPHGFKTSKSAAEHNCKQKICTQGWRYRHYVYCLCAHAFILIMECEMCI